MTRHPSSRDNVPQVADQAVQQAAAGDAASPKALSGQVLQWLGTGAALGLLRSGARVAGRVVRRNPLLVGAVVVGAGVLWYAAHKRAQRKAVLEGQARRLQALRREEYEQDDMGV